MHHKTGTEHNQRAFLRPTIILIGGSALLFIIIMWWVDSAYDWLQKAINSTIVLLAAALAFKKRCGATPLIPLLPWRGDDNNHYLVTWQIDIFNAKTPLEAAKEAFQLIRLPDTTANVFDVRDASGKATRIDLQAEDE